MKKILNIISSPRGEASFSNKLGYALLGKIKTVYPDAIVSTLDLNELSLPHVQATHLEAFFTPPEQRTELHHEYTKISDQLIRDIFDTDIIVMNIPTYNFSIPSAVKAWIDQIARAGVTFRYSERGAEGLITGKKVYVAISSGAIFSVSPWNANDFVEPYLRAILGFVGLTDLTFVRVEGLGMPVVRDTALDKALSAVADLKVA